MNLRKVFLTIVAVAILPCLAFPAAVFALTPVRTGVAFSNILNGAKVKSPVKVEMQVYGKILAPAGDPAPNSGHYHIIIDGGSIEEGKIVPADAKHIHFGLAQKEAELKLEKGKHTLTLQFADKNHISYGKAWSETISIEVIE